MESISLLAGFFAFRRRITAAMQLAGYALITSLLFLSIYRWGTFPSCFVEGEGLTPFKIYSEYAIGGITFCAMVVLWLLRRRFDRYVLILLMMSLGITIAAEVIFTFYSGMFQMANFAGHYCKLLSFVFIYIAAIQIGLEEPYRVLFRELKLNEESLGRERDFIEAVLQHESALVTVLDETGRVTRVNRAMVEVTGYEATELEGEFLWELLVPPDQPRTCRDLVERARDAGCSDIAEVIWLTRKKERLHVNWSCARIDEGLATGVYYVGTGLDMTELRRAEKALLQSARLAAVGELAEGVAHHFNNIHAGILGYVDLVRTDDTVNENCRRRLDRAVEGIKRATEVTRNILHFAQAPRGETVPIELGRLVHEAVSLYENTFEQQGVTLRFDDVGAVPPVAVDPGALREVLLALLSNAHHALIGQTHKEINFATAFAEGMVELRVSDNGCGIRPEDMPRIFDPMFSTKGERAHPGSLQLRVRGVGLGLSIAASILRDHDGGIHLESVPGQGTTVVVRLPAASSVGTTPSRTPSR